MDTQPSETYKETSFRIHKNKQFLVKIFNRSRFSEKSVNPVYATFKGGYSSYNIAMTKWEYFCLWGHFRICFDKTDLIDNWKHLSFYGYRDGYTYTPVKKLLWNFKLHMAYGKKFPFIKFGFNKIWNISKDNHQHAQ